MSVKNMRHTALRAMIREFLLRPKLPTSTPLSGSSSVTDDASSAIKAAKEILLAIVAIRGAIFVLDNKDEIITFAQNARRAAGDLYDIVTAFSTNESLIMQEDTENVFKTAYGDVTTAKADRLVMKNIYSAGKKLYIPAPSDDVDTADELRATFTPVIDKLGEVINSLIRIVEDTNKNFPGNFSSLISLTPVNADDIDSDEQLIINKATTDAVAVAIFNSVKTQMQKTVAGLKNNIKTVLADDEDKLQEFDNIINEFAKDVADEFEKVRGREAEDILVK